MTMDQNSYNIEKDQYFLKSKNKENLSDQFIKYLEDNTEVKDEFDFENKLRKALEEEYRAKMKKLTDEVIKEKSVKPKKSSWISIIGIAASMLLLFGVVTLFTQKEYDNNSNYEAMLEDYLKSNVSKSGLRSGGTVNTFSDSMSLVTKNIFDSKYSEAEIILDDLIEAYPLNEEVRFNKAVTSFYKNDFEKCEALVSLLVNSNDKEIRQEAEIMLIQIKMKGAKNIEAKKMLQLIANSPKHKYYGFSKEKLKKMN